MRRQGRSLNPVKRTKQNVSVLGVIAPSMPTTRRMIANAQNTGPVGPQGPPGPSAISASILGIDGRLLMSVLPQNLTDALVALLEAQQETNAKLAETNELLFNLFQQQQEKSEQEGVVTSGL